MKIFVNLFMKNVIPKIDQSNMNYHMTLNTIFWLIGFIFNHLTFGAKKLAACGWASRGG